MAYDEKLKSAKLFIALIETACEGKISNIIKCLEEGANINEQFVNDSNNTPLHISVMRKDLEVLDLLLKRGAKTNCKNNDGKTALDIAKELDSDEATIITELLEAHDCKQQTITSEKKKSIDNNELISNCKYLKRDGTSGIEGKLYETKLITLIQIRSFIKEYDEFYLGTNLKDTGALDDICIRYKQDNKDIIVFLQAKHRINVTKGKVINDALWRPIGDFSLLNYFESYMDVRERFTVTKESDVMFSGKYEDLNYYLVIYTTAANELEYRRTCEHHITDKYVRDLIQSGKRNDVIQCQFTDDVVDTLTKSALIKEMHYLGKSLYNIIKRNKFHNTIKDCRYIHKYHVVLAQSVINVSDVNTAGHRAGTFRAEFFDSNDELLMALKESLLHKAVEDVKFNRDIMNKLVQEVAVEPTVVSISKLMQTLPIRYDIKTSTLFMKKSNSVKDIAEALCKVKIKYKVYEEACCIAVKMKFNSLCFNLPITFGNIDISVSDGNKGVKRLEYLCGEIEKIMLHFKDKMVIINDELIGPNKLVSSGVMDLKAGLKGAIGNLLILSELDDLLKFNLNHESLGKNAKTLLKLLKSKVNNLDNYRVKLDVEGIPKLSLKPDARDRVLVKDFFNHLWFYTNQAKEDEIVDHAIEILQEYIITAKNASEVTATRARCEAIYFKIHDVVQKWWMCKGESYYLSNDRKILNEIVKEILDSSLLNIINSDYRNRMKTYDIQFDESSVQALNTQLSSVCTVIVTDIITLIGIKLVQHFQTLKDCAFIELDSHLLLSRNDRDTLKEEIMNKMLETIIIIYGDVTEYKSELFRYIIKETTSKQIIILTRTYAYENSLRHIIDKRKFTKVSDIRIEFNDLILNSQTKVLSSKLMFQDNEITFNSIIQEDAKYLITPYMLQKIIYNDKIVVGRTISNPNYEQVKYYYVDRKLQIRNERNLSIELNTFKDINDTVVLVGAPGIGKSTYLTHMSIKTKELYPNIWIVRINLLDYTKEFHRWQKHKIEIDRIETLKFVCKAAVYKIIQRNNIDFNFEEIVFDLEIINGEFVLRNYNRNDFISFELEMFIYCYNKGKTVLLFDGFDEICPHYKEEITELLKCLLTRSLGINSPDSSSHKQQMWITSRSYNNIIITLETEFGTPYDLKALTLTELEITIMKFFKINLNLTKLNYEQFMNIDSFFEYMKQNYNMSKTIVFKSSWFLLHELYILAVKYFQRETKCIHLVGEKYDMAEKWWAIQKFKSPIVSSNTLLPIRIINLKNKQRRKTTMDVLITPLHVYLTLEYFTNQIKNFTLQNTSDDFKWNLEANALTFYKYFLETKLRKIRFKNKNQMDLYNPDVKLTYARELKEYLDRHKKIAFYATFIEELEEILSQVEINEMRQTIKEFEAAEEKTGVVDHVINGVPKFIHFTFQQYLTVEYITDLLKTKPQEDQLELWKFIIKNVGDPRIVEFFDDKFLYDNELQNIILSNELKKVFYNEIVTRHWQKINAKSSYEYIRIVSCASFNGLRYILKFIITALVDVVDKHNYEEFISFVNTYYILGNSVSDGWDEISIIILNCIRRIDPTKICELECYGYGRLKKDVTGFSNEDIIRHFGNMILLKASDRGT